MPLNHCQIAERLDAGLVTNIPFLDSLKDAGIILKYDDRALNTASLDIHLGRTILVERPTDNPKPISYRRRERLVMDEIDISKKPYPVRPGQFILAHTIEVLKFQNDLAALLRIKSSQGRIGFEHLDAGWVDPGFEGALTLEYKNMLEYHPFEIQYGDPIGQLVLFAIDEVPAEFSYKKVGRYGGHDTVEQIK